MGRYFMPIIDIQPKPARSWSLDLLEFNEFVVEDELTYTCRLFLDPAMESIEEVKESVRERIRELYALEKAESLIRLLEENEWDVSFFADCF